MDVPAPVPFSFQQGVGQNKAFSFPAKVNSHSLYFLLFLGHTCLLSLILCLLSLVPFFAIL
jgi:hypothetical protein